MPPEDAAGVGVASKRRLADLLSRQGCDLEGRDSAHAAYVAAIPTRPWQGWWALWVFGKEEYRAVYLTQDDDGTVAGEWLSARGVTYRFEGSVSESRLRVTGARCERVETGVFASPLSMALSHDARCITLNWDWHLLYPNGTAPRQVVRAHPEVFVVTGAAHLSPEQRVAAASAAEKLRSLLPGTFAVASSVEPTSAATGGVRSVICGGDVADVAGNGDAAASSRPAFDFATVEDCVFHHIRSGLLCVWVAAADSADAARVLGALRAARFLFAQYVVAPEDDDCTKAVDDGDSGVGPPTRDTQFNSPTPRFTLSDPAATAHKVCKAIVADSVVST